MSGGEYDIKAEQGATYNLFLLYQTNDETGIDLKNYTSTMQVRRSVEDNDLLLWVTGTTMDPDTGLVYDGGVTGGGVTGEFVAGSGVSGIGDIKLNADSDGSTGNTGGIVVAIDADTMTNVPPGKHFYDLEIVAGSGSVTKIVRGRFEVTPEVTR